MGFGALLSCLAPASAQTNTVTVRGQVVEMVHSTWIGGATVRLSGRPFFVTESDGAFRFTDVSPGSYTLSVEVMGYRPREIQLMIRADTALLVLMEVDPIRLDSLLVVAGTINIDGRITDAITGRGIPAARISTGLGRETFSRSGGSFKLKKLPRGRSIPFTVDAYKYRPARIAIITEEDTTLVLALEPDPVSIRLFELAVEALETRASAVALSEISLDRDYLDVAPNRRIYDVIKWKLGKDFSPRCLFVDDVRWSEPGILYSYSASEIERVEIFARGTMIRVYTQGFVARHFGTARRLPRIIYIRPGIGPEICY